MKKFIIILFEWMFAISGLILIFTNLLTKNNVVLTCRIQYILLLLIFSAFSITSLIIILYINGLFKSFINNIRHNKDPHDKL